MHLYTASATLLAAATAPQLVMGFDCQKLKADDYTFDLSALKGPHSVVTSSFLSGSGNYHNTTYTLDICDPLAKGKVISEKEGCPKGSRVCGVRNIISGDKKLLDDVITIAGDLADHGGSDMDAKLVRLSKSDSESDKGKEGVRLTLQGGKHPLDGPTKDRRPQKAIIELLCDKEKEGTEGEWETDEKYFDAKSKRDDKDDKSKDPGAKEEQLKKAEAALIWKSYEADGDSDVLRLEWHTKHACEKRDGNDDDKNKDDKGKDGDKDGKGKDGDKGDEKEPEQQPSSGNWGFFTWLIIIVFLSVAAYLIFGSWLNYNRYGSRGWDLLPHGDTIREIPYLLKDFLRRVLNSVQGAGSRGGYSAV